MKTNDQQKSLDILFQRRKCIRGGVTKGMDCIVLPTDENLSLHSYSYASSFDKKKQERKHTEVQKQCLLFQKTLTIRQERILSRKEDNSKCRREMTICN